MRAVLGPEAEENHAARAQRQLDERALAVEVLVTEEPARQERVAAHRIAREEHAGLRLEGRTALEPHGERLEAVRDRAGRLALDLDLQDRARAVEILRAALALRLVPARLAVDAGEHVGHGQRKLRDRHLRGGVQGDERAALFDEGLQALHPL
ncbi:MAG: hypothetical protein DMF82_22365, partial [Acidobacteria bacterium]